MKHISDRKIIIATFVISVTNLIVNLVDWVMIFMHWKG